MSLPRAVETILLPPEIDNTENSNESSNSNQTDSKTSTKMKITIGNQSFTANFSDTEAAKQFKEKLPITLNMQDYSGFEKIATIDRLTTSDRQENSLGLGDIMLYGGNSLVLFYANHGEYNYTRIGKIENTDGLREALGSNNITNTFSID